MILSEEKKLPLSRPAGEGRGEGVWKLQRHSSASRAQELRRNQTDAEKKIWSHLKAKRFLGYKFRRQFPIGFYIADFACPEIKLIVEIDGGQHCESAKDEKRTVFLQAQGYEVVRFWNNDVLGNIEGVLNTLSLTLSRKRERGSAVI